MYYREQKLNKLYRQESERKAQKAHYVRALYRDEAYREEHSLLNRLKRALRDLVQVQPQVQNRSRYVAANRKLRPQN